MKNIIVCFFSWFFVRDSALITEYLMFIFRFLNLRGNIKYFHAILVILKCSFTIRFNILFEVKLHFITLNKIEFKNFILRLFQSPSTIKWRSNFVKNFLSEIFFLLLLIFFWAHKQIIRSIFSNFFVSKTKD